jgi:hypothetical protein
MAFTYSASTAANRDQVRLLIGDTTAATAVFQDEELDIFLALCGGDPRIAAAQALRTIAANESKFAVFYRVIGGFEMDRRSVARELRDTANKLEEAAIAVPFEFESTFDHVIDHAGRDLSNYQDTEA